MRLDMRLRGAGKTYDMVQEHMITPNSVILVDTMQRAESIRNGIPNGEKAMILDIMHFQKLVGRKPFDVVFIDELETVLRSLLRGLSGAEIVANTWGEEEPEEDSEELFPQEFIDSLNETLSKAKQALRTYLS